MAPEKKMPPFGVAYFSLRSLHHNNFRKFCKPDLQHENAAKQIYPLFCGMMIASIYTHDPRAIALHCLLSQMGR